MDTKDIIISVVAEILDLNQENIEPSHHFIKDLEADSLDLIIILMTLEEEFSIEVPDSIAEKIMTIQEAVDIVNDRFI